jgi:t-SNARE complex subunit (syntaxin)
MLTRVGPFAVEMEDLVTQYTSTTVEDIASYFISLLIIIIIIIIILFVCKV